jgi:hypothetical protein
MLYSRFKVPYILSILITMLAAVTSAGGLFISGLYRDNTWVTTQLQGNDLVTLAVATPLLVWALFLLKQDSPRVQLVWLAMLGYMLYNYVFYLYGATFNYFFLLYVALVALSVFALILALTKIDLGEIKQSFRVGTPVKWISGWMLFIAVVLGGMWISQSLAFVFTGKIPQVIINAGSQTSVVFATDLSLLVPFMVVGAILLWKRQGWGYVLGVMLMLKGATYTLALLAMGWFSAQAGTLGDDWSFLPLWAVLCAGCLIATGFLLGNIRVAKKPEDSMRPVSNVQHLT